MLVNSKLTSILTREEFVARKLRFFCDIGYKPGEGQLSAHVDMSRFLIVLAGARFGKSMLAGAEVAFALMCPGARIWLVGPTYDLAEKELIHTLDFLSRKRIKNKRVTDLCRISTASRGSRYIKTPWDSFVATKSTEKLSTLLGEELDIVVFCEGSQHPREAWNRYLRARLGSRQGRLIATSTGSGDSGIFADFVEWGRSKKEKYKEWSVHEHRTIDNPTFSRDEWEAAKLELPAKVFAEQYEGKLVSVRGHVFPQFGPHNIVDKMPPGSENWPVFLTWHHEKNASNNPVVCLIVAVEPVTRKFYVYDEYYVVGEIFNNAALTVREKIRGRRVIGNLTDYRNPTLRENLKKMGTVSANNEKSYPQKHAVVRRIQAVQTDLQDVEGGPRINILRSCLNTVRDFKRAKWPEAQPEQKEMAETEMPTTKYMPAPLALSYLVAYIKISTGNDIYTAQREKK